MSKRLRSKKQARRLERKAKQRAQEKAIRDEFGYTALHEAGKRSQRPEFPNLKVPQPKASTTALFGPTPAPRPLPPDAKQFPVGNSHKQGLELILPSEKEWMGGKKS